MTLVKTMASQKECTVAVRRATVLATAGVILGQLGHQELSDSVTEVAEQIYNDAQIEKGKTK